MILSPSSYRDYIERFNSEDQTESQSKSLSIPNRDAWAFLEQNIPWFDCPDKKFEETYYYRWWCFRKHLTKTPAGWVVTEFLPEVPWAGIYNTISCAAGHHLYEGRWLRDQQYVEDYAQFWLFPEAQPRNYSFWIADAVRAVTLASGDVRLERKLLPNLIANFHAWEKTNRDKSGLFKQIDSHDGMEYSLGGSGFRPSINSYMFGDAVAIAAIARECGLPKVADEFRTKAAEIKNLVQARLWNPKDEFFETESEASGSGENRSAGVRELIGFTPWYFNLPDRQFDGAWKQLLDPNGFAAPFGPTTVEKRAKGFMHPEDHDCLWNGPSWPYATTQTLVALANLLERRSPSGIVRHDYFNLLRQYASSQQKDGRPWIAENLEADSGKWIVDLPRSVNYNHSGFADLVVTGLAGLRPRLDSKIVLNPLLPNGEWPWFCLDGIPYHGQSLSVLWDVDGNHYGRGKGLTLFVDGEIVAHRADLGELDAHLSAKVAKLPPLTSTSWEKHAEGPVLGGELGTCFDTCVLQNDRRSTDASWAYKMYFSWRPKQSVAVVQSVDGVHWSFPKILIAPKNSGWEDDINRPSVVLQGGIYHMWYTAQSSEHSAIGYATSTDGIQWVRQDHPVLLPDQPWEKVAVMCPSVLWDERSKEFRMWYSGGEQYEPDAIGYAVSPDGVHWKKRDAPVFDSDPENLWEQYKVTACQVLPWEGWYYMFYIGFRDIDHAQIGIARSRDGISDWERLPDNPIISPTVDGWDAEACYKPFVVFDRIKKRWLLWYNGRNGSVEQIGLATRPGPDLGFK